MSFSHVTSISDCVLPAKALSISCALVLSCSVSALAHEVNTCKSPDGKFALHETFNDLVPIHGDSAIIESGTGKVVMQLHGDEPAGSEKLVWSKDSQRVVSFRDDWRNGTTRIFFRNGATFEEIKMPELDPVALNLTYIRNTLLVRLRDDFGITLIQFSIQFLVPRFQFCFARQWSTGSAQARNSGFVLFNFRKYSVNSNVLVRVLK